MKSDRRSLKRWVVVLTNIVMYLHHKVVDHGRQEGGNKGPGCPIEKAAQPGA